MKKAILAFLSLIVFTGAYAHADVATVGSPAPAFTAKNSYGEDVSLKNFEGKTVVLEWFNPGCPFVKKFYSNGDMQRFQKTVLDKGGVWLTINSNAEGKQGHLAPSEATELMKELHMQSTALLLDSEGTIGKLYGARTTPHMFVIDGKGALQYAGAIDSVPSTRSQDIAASTNYVLNAFEALAADRAPAPSATEPYGCSVKYASK